MLEPPRDPTIVRHEEELHVEPVRRYAGSVRVHKRVERHGVADVVERRIEAYDVERIPPEGADSREIEMLPDGSVSVPLLAEEIVVEKRRVVRERVVVRRRR